MLGVSVVGSIVGALVLLHTTNAAFTQLIPFLLFFSTSLFVVGSDLTRAVRSKQVSLGVDSPVGLTAQSAIAVYGGFFGAAARILILALLGLLGMNEMRRANALKVLLAATINGVAVMPFVIARDRLGRGARRMLVFGRRRLSWSRRREALAVEHHSQLRYPSRLLHDGLVFLENIYRSLCLSDVEALARHRIRLTS